MDLSDWAGVFILVIIVGIALLMLAAYRMGKPASIVFLLALIGEFVGFWICRLCGFENATLETVVTLMISIFLPTSLIICKWAFPYFKEIRERKIQVLKAIIIEDYELRKREICKEKERLEKDLLKNSSVHNLLMLFQLCVSTNLNFYENPEICKEREKRNELLQTINDKEKELNIIDSYIEDVRIDNRYSQLIRIRRGDMK